MIAIRLALVAACCFSYVAFVTHEHDNTYAKAITQYKEDPDFHLSASHRFSKGRSSLFSAHSESTEHLRAAEVVFLGNSRPLIGLSHDLIASFSKKTNRKAFNLSFDLSDNTNFASWLLDDLNHRPEYLLIHLGPYIFSGEFTPASFESISKGRWINSVEYLDFQIGSMLQMHTHANWGQFRLADQPFYMYRSVKTGCVKLSGNLKPTKFRYVATNQPLPRQMKKSAKAFCRWAEQRSIQPILFQVPAPRLDPSQVARLGDYLDVPYVESLEGDYHTFDNSHLTPADAEKFTRVLLAELGKIIDPDPTPGK